jgi:hypothetical protein
LEPTDSFIEKSLSSLLGPAWFARYLSGAKAAVSLPKDNIAGRS